MPHIPDVVRTERSSRLAALRRIIFVERALESYDDPRPPSDVHVDDAEVRLSIVEAHIEGLIGDYRAADRALRRRRR